MLGERHNTGRSRWRVTGQHQQVLGVCPQESSGEAMREWGVCCSSRWIVLCGLLQPPCNAEECQRLIWLHLGKKKPDLSLPLLIFIPSFATAQGWIWAIVAGQGHSPFSPLSHGLCCSAVPSTSGGLTCP